MGVLDINISSLFISLASTLEKVSACTPYLHIPPFILHVLYLKHFQQSPPAPTRKLQNDINPNYQSTVGMQCRF